MRILAIESALAGGSVAALDDGTLLAEIDLEPHRRTAQTLLPAMRDVLRQVTWKPRDVQLVGVTQGPGSFTSLRIGVTAAKTFAYAAGTEILGISTLAVLAEPVPPSPSCLWTILDAERKQLFAACYRHETGIWTESQSVKIVDQATWLASLRDNDLVSGPALARLVPLLPPGAMPTANDMWLPRASCVGQIVGRLYAHGARADVWSLEPDYVRQSSAEEKLKG